MPAPTESPCTTRQPMRPCTEAASAAPTDASVYTTSATMITGLRPKLSESAPWKRNISPKAKRYPESVCWICSGVAPSEAWMPAKAGRYASIEKGPSVESDASIAAKPQRKRRDARSAAGVVRCRGSPVGSIHAF